jgi:pyruvate-formate lyase
MHTGELASRRAVWVATSLRSSALPTFFHPAPTWSSTLLGAMRLDFPSAQEIDLLYCLIKLMEMDSPSPSLIKPPVLMTS